MSVSSRAPAGHPGDRLRLVWPEWQGAGSSSIRALTAEFPFEVGRRGYTVGTTVLQAVLPAHTGPTEIVPVTLGNDGLEERDGIEAKDAVLAQLDAALEIIRQHDPAKITTLGGDCGVSLAPFSALIDKYGDDIAVLWIGSHPDMGTGKSAYSGFHAMVVSALTGHGDAEILSRLPGRIPAARVALVGMHDWTDDALPSVAEEWGLTVFPPELLRGDSTPLRTWLRRTGVSRVAVHFDVDTIDAAEVQFGLGADVGGLTTEQAKRVVSDIESEVEVVALTIAEFVPRQIIRLLSLLEGFPLLGPGAR
ncbi:MAG: arginase family protein [Microbacterium sp.]